MVLMIIMWWWQSILRSGKTNESFFSRENFLFLGKFPFNILFQKNLVFFLFIFEIFWKILKFTFFSTIHSFISSECQILSLIQYSDFLLLWWFWLLLLLWSPYVYRKNWSTTTTTTIESNWFREYGIYSPFQFESSNGWFVCSTSNNNIT